MTDMTAEWFAAHDFWQLGKVDDGRAMLLVTEDEYNAIRHALSAPRVPEGWLVMRSKYGITVQGPSGIAAEICKPSGLLVDVPKAVYLFLESMLTAAPAPADVSLIDEGNIGQVSDSDDISKLRERVKELESLGYSAAARLIAVEDALSDLADYVDERNGDHECRPLENARRALGGPYISPYISPYMNAIERLCEIANTNPFSAIGHSIEHDPKLWPLRIIAARLRAEQVTKVGAMEVTHDAEGRVSKVNCPMPLFTTMEGEEIKRLRERVKVLESERENLLSQILDIANAAGDGVPDAIDNDGQPYQSHTLSMRIAEAARLREGGSQ